MGDQSQFVLICLVLVIALGHPLIAIGQASGSAEYIPNDPKLDQTWARNIGVLAGWKDILDIDHAGQAKMPLAIIAVLDAEVNWNHPEFQDLVLAQYAYNATDEPYSGSLFSHGTANLGPSSAKGDNGMGVAGISGLGGRVKFIPIKVVADNNTFKDEWVLAGLQKVLEYKRAGLPIVVAGVNVLGGVSDAVAMDQTLKALAAEGVDIVAPSENTTVPLNIDEFTIFPVSYSRLYDNIIPVVAGDESAERLASFSAIGPKTLRIVVPGVNVRTVSALDPNGSASTSGNSAATFQVAAAMANIRVYREPDAKKAREILYFTARMFPELEGKIKASPGSSDDAGRMAGRLDLHDALTMQFGCPASSTAISLVTQRGSARLIALDSVVKTSGPFLTESPLNFFSSDHQTRITIYAYNIGLFPGENTSAVMVQAKDSANHNVTLPVEFVNSLNDPLSCISQINIKLQPLPPQAALAAGDVSLTVSLHGQTSAPGIVSIRSAQ